MGLKKKKLVGEARKFMNRSQALKKLQISLKDFRRLSILKGIYPRVPKNKRKLNKGSSKLTTWYYRRDIQYLLHEPLLQKLRDWKTYAKKLTKLNAKQEWKLVKDLKKREPQFNLNHIIRERYPTFNDALRDMDDAVSMACLFSALPKIGRHVTPQFLLDCQQKKNDFFRYVAQTHSLKKAFVSIKGIYFQAEIHRQLITWVVPHPFTQEVPKNVDLKVMLTFSQLYESLLGFVLFKLYKDQQWTYPPAPGPDPRGAGWPCILNLPDVMVSKSATAGEAYGDAVVSGSVPVLDTFVKIKASASDLPTIEVQPGVFSGCVFYLSRETNVYILATLVYSMGGQVGWDETAVERPSKFKETDPRITHHVVDRPTTPSGLPARVYIQPQWVFDCLNANQRLLVSMKDGSGYAPGETLPPHLSPFAKTGPYEYNPADLTASVDQVPEKPLGHALMSKSQQRLYDSIQQTREAKVGRIQRLKKRRELIDRLKSEFTTESVNSDALNQ